MSHFKVERIMYEIAKSPHDCAQEIKFLEEIIHTEIHKKFSLDMTFLGQASKNPELLEFFLSNRSHFLTLQNIIN